MRQRAGKLLGGSAVLSASLAVVPPVVSEARGLLSVHYVEHYMIRGARNALYASLVLCLFIYLHFAWRSDAIRPAVRALGAVCAIFAFVFGLIVCREAPKFWIVWPTYGQDLQFGLALWAFASFYPGSKLLACAVALSTGGLLEFPGFSGQIVSDYAAS